MNLANVQPSTSTVALAQLAQAPASSNGVCDDAWALTGWLGFVSLRNKQTLRSYRKEVMRFRMFLEVVHATNAHRPSSFLLRDTTEMDVLLYEAHLSGRLRTGEAVTPLVVPGAILARYGKKDQPFVTYGAVPEHAPAMPTALQLKASSVAQALSILHALYQHWMLPDPVTKVAYVGANPVKRVKGASNRMQRQTNRNFPIEAVQAMMDAIEWQMRDLDDDAPQRATLARRRWIAAMLFGLWGRRAEIARLRMCDFVHDGVRWGVHIVRKGGKEQVLPVAPWVIQELVNYRQFLSLTPLPSSDDESPCLRRLKETRSSAEKSVDPDLIYREVIALCKDTASMVRSATVMPDIGDAERELLAHKLDDISPHWFRHSGASISINSGAMSLENASKMLGHSTPVITSEMYFHPSESQISDGMQKLGGQIFQAKR